jgi:hypothetical protein
VTLACPHTYSYVPDVAAGLANPTLRELTETYYQFGEPFILDTTKYQTTFGAARTPLADAIAATLAWYRTRPGPP